MTLHVDLPAHYSLICTAAGLDPNFHSDHCISFSNDKGEFVGGNVYQGYNKASIRVHTHVRLPRQVTPKMLGICFDYPFFQLKVAKLIAPVPSFNTKSIAFAEKLGFKYETAIKGVYLKGDQLIYSMTPETCRWLAHAPRRAA